MVTGAKVYNTCNMIVLEMYPVRGGTSDVRLRNKGVREDTFEKKSVCLLKREVSQVALVVKNLLVNAGDVRDKVRSLGQEDPLEKELATHSSILAWRIPLTEEPGGLQSMGLQSRS